MTPNTALSLALRDTFGISGGSDQRVAHVFHHLEENGFFVAHESQLKKEKPHRDDCGSCGRVWYNCLCGHDDL